MRRNNFVVSSEERAIVKHCEKNIEKALGFEGNDDKWVNISINQYDTGFKVGIEVFDRFIKPFTTLDKFFERKSLLDALKAVLEWSENMPFPN